MITYRNIYRNAYTQVNICAHTPLLHQVKGHKRKDTPTVMSALNTQILLSDTFSTVPALMGRCQRGTGTH